MSDYSGCGTFFGLTKDPTKRACYLEKRIAKAMPKCQAGKQKQCSKITRWQSEIASITGVSPVAQATTADLFYQQALAEEQMAVAAYQQKEKSAGDRLMPVAAVGIAGLLVIWALAEE